MRTRLGSELERVPDAGQRGLVCRKALYAGRAAFRRWRPPAASGEFQGGAPAPIGVNASNLATTPCRGLTQSFFDRHSSRETAWQFLNLVPVRFVIERQPSRSDHRGVDLISDALPFGRLWYAGGGSHRQCNRVRHASQPFT